MTWWEALILGVVQGLTEFFPVSSSGRLADLDAVRDGLFHRKRAGNRLAFDVLHHEVAATRVLADILKGADVRVIERRDRVCLPLEALGKRTLQRFDGDVTFEPDVFCAVHVAHASRSGGLDDLVRT